MIRKLVLWPAAVVVGIIFATAFGDQWGYIAALLILVAAGPLW